MHGKNCSYKAPCHTFVPNTHLASFPLWRWLSHIPTRCHSESSSVPSSSNMLARRIPWARWASCSAHSRNSQKDSPSQSFLGTMQGNHRHFHYSVHCFYHSSLPTLNQSSNLPYLRPSIRYQHAYCFLQLTFHSHRSSTWPNQPSYYFSHRLFHYYWFQVAHVRRVICLWNESVPDTTSFQEWLPQWWRMQPPQ